MLATANAVDAAQLATTLRQQLTNQSERHNVVANADIRRITLTIFDRTFAITHVLRLLAILVAFVGILSALLTLQLQRLREYALLRATGMTGRETALVIAGQTLFLGLLAGLLALPLGLVMADVLIDVINQRSFGWSMQHTLPPSVLIQAVLLAVGAALLAGWYPMKRVAAVLPAAGMQQ
jgi:putative ABC transport system permease protein